VNQTLMHMDFLTGVCKWSGFYHLWLLSWSCNFRFNWIFGPLRTL